MVSTGRTARGATLVTSPRSTGPGPGHDEERGHAGPDRQDETFECRPRDQSRAAGPEREPDRGLAPPRDGPGEQKVGDIRARDQQDDARDRGEPDRDARLERRVRTHQAARPRRGSRDVPPRPAARTDRPSEWPCTPLRHLRRVRLRLGDREPGFLAREDVHPAPLVDA